MGVKWRPPALAALRQAVGDQGLAAAAGAPSSGKKAKRKSLANGGGAGEAAGSPSPVESQLAGVLADMVHLGAGLVDHIEVITPLA